MASLGRVGGEGMREFLVYHEFKSEGTYTGSEITMNRPACPFRSWIIIIETIGW